MTGGNGHTRSGRREREETVSPAERVVRVMIAEGKRDERNVTRGDLSLSRPHHSFYNSLFFNLFALIK